ncbi:MAG: hypothetical protein KJO42_05380 [Silicimonas sp.]|nr:hypothetical protein [Silicimonas sp.]
MLKRLLIIFSLVLAPGVAGADSASVRDRIVSELRDDGYREIRMSRTLLGRLRFVATRRDAVREIVVNPFTGVILRDYVRFLRRGGSGGDDDYDDDYDDDDYDDNSGKGSSNSGSGSSNSGSGSSNSGSGSSNSGSGSSSSGSGSGGDDDD